MPIEIKRPADGISASAIANPSSDGRTSRSHTARAPVVERIASVSRASMSLRSIPR